MMMSLLRRSLAIKPKSKPAGYYDYLQVELDNPNRPIDDPYVFKNNEAMYSSLEIGLILYSVLGVTVFYITRIIYDRDWDRYYHVNYPATMEHFDNLVSHYKKKTKTMIEELPSGIDEIYQQMLNVLGKNLPKNIKIIKIEDIVVETKLGETLSSAIGITEDPSFNTKKKLIEDLTNDS